MNPAVRCAVEYSETLGLTPHVIYDGLEGMIEGSIVPATREITEEMAFRGGTLLRSSRSQRFFEYDYRKQAYEHLKARNIDKLIILGGDGSFRALNDFYNDFKVPFAGIPATIDNDIAGTDYCLGVDTAQNIIVDCIDTIRDTAHSHNRAFVVEVMGRDCGYLAMTTALAGGAAVCIVPEFDYDLGAIYNRLIKEREKSKSRYLIAVVAEGTRIAPYLTRWIEETLGMDTRLTVLGHLQRGGVPTVRDRLMATRFAVAAVNSLVKGDPNKIMVYKDGEYGKVDLSDVAGQKYTVSPYIVNLCKHLSH